MIKESIVSSNLLLSGASRILLMAKVSDALSKVIARNARFLKDKLDIKEDEVARRAGFAQKTFNNILNENHKPTLLTVEKLAHGFRVEPWELLKPEFDQALPSDDELQELDSVVSRLGYSATKKALQTLLGTMARKDAVEIITHYLTQMDPDDRDTA